MNDYSEPMDVDTLHQMYLNMEARLNATQGFNQRGNGRNARGNGLYQQRSGRNPVGCFNNATRETECYYCHKKGHYARDCYQKQRDDAQSQLHAIQQPFYNQYQAPYGGQNISGNSGNPFMEQNASTLPPAPPTHPKN